MANKSKTQKNSYTKSKTILFWLKKNWAYIIVFTGIFSFGVFFGKFQSIRETNHLYSEIEKLKSDTILLRKCIRSDCKCDSIITPKMVKIPGGVYKIGLSKLVCDSLVKIQYANQEDFSIEMPQNKITINDFEISKYEITVKEFKEYLKDKNVNKEIDNEFNDNDQPIVNVTWYEANDYCLWLSQKTGGKYRLPYEIEWEIASKGNTERIYPWGNDSPNNNICNYKYSNINRTISVLNNPSNQSFYGLYNMSGNAAEWCLDWYYSDHYKKITKGKIIDLPESLNKVIRGGGWNSIDFDLRCTARTFAKPNDKSNNIGFRIVKSYN